MTTTPSIREAVAREETTLDEVVRRIEEGSFYHDYDWASGPALRALRRSVALIGSHAVEQKEGISSERCVLPSSETGAPSAPPEGWREQAAVFVDMAERRLTGYCDLAWNGEAQWDARDACRTVYGVFLGLREDLALRGYLKAEADDRFSLRDALAEAAREVVRAYPIEGAHEGPISRLGATLAEIEARS